MISRSCRVFAPRLSHVSPVTSVLARTLRTAPVPKAELTTTESNAIAKADPMTFVEAESLADHQARVRHSDPSNRTFNYTMIGGARFVGASMARLLVVKALAHMNPAANVLALASVEVDVGKLEPGNCMTIKWRGKPVFIRSRTEAEIAEAEAVNMGELRDPQADSERVEKPETLVVLGVCTHLGCVPVSNAGDFGGWFCPCHGSHYDVSGRIRKGPAPLNLEVPPYSFIEDTKVVIG